MRTFASNQIVKHLSGPPGDPGRKDRLAGGLESRFERTPPRIRSRDPIDALRNPKIEKNRFRKATATGSAISRTETYCLTLRLLLLSTRLPKIRSRRKRQSQLFLAAPSDFQYFSTALASCATPIHLDGFLTGVPPPAGCDPLTSSGITPAHNHRARQQTDHTRAHRPSATIPVWASTFFRRSRQTIENKRPMDQPPSRLLPPAGLPVGLVGIGALPPRVFWSHSYGQHLVVWKAFLPHHR